MQIAQAVQEELDCELDKNCKEITASASPEDIVSVSLPVGPKGERKLVDVVKVAAYNDGAYTQKRNARCGYATFIEKKTRKPIAQKLLQSFCKTCSWHTRDYLKRVCAVEVEHPDALSNLIGHDALMLQKFQGFGMVQRQRAGGARCELCVVLEQEQRA